MSGLHYAVVPFRQASRAQQDKSVDSAALGNVIAAACVRKRWQTNRQLYKMVEHGLRLSIVSENLGSVGWFHSSALEKALLGSKRSLETKAKQGAKNLLVRRLIELGLMERCGHWLRVIVAKLRWLKIRNISRSKGFDLQSSFYPLIRAGKPVSRQNRSARSCRSIEGLKDASQAKREAEQGRNAKGQFVKKAPDHDFRQVRAEALRSLNPSISEEEVKEALKRPAAPPPSCQTLEIDDTPHLDLADRSPEASRQASESAAKDLRNDQVKALELKGEIARELKRPIAAMHAHAIEARSNALGQMMRMAHELGVPHQSLVARIAELARVYFAVQDPPATIEELRALRRRVPWLKPLSIREAYRVQGSASLWLYEAKQLNRAVLTDTSDQHNFPGILTWRVKKWVFQQLMPQASVC